MSADPLGEAVCAASENGIRGTLVFEHQEHRFASGKKVVRRRGYVSTGLSQRRAAFRRPVPDNNPLASTNEVQRDRCSHRPEANEARRLPLRHERVSLLRERSLMADLCSEKTKFIEMRIAKIG